jgi:hypothetical protein
MKRRPVSRAPRSACRTRAAWEGKSGTNHVFLGFLGFRQGPVSDLPTGIVQSANRVFEIGWLRRIATYHSPIADPESSPKPAPMKSLRVTAAQ